MNKISMLKLSVIAAVLALASTPSTLHAQSPVGLAQVKVPFAFEVGSAHFAPGVYTAGVLNGSTLYVRGAKSGAFASMRLDGGGKTITATKVVFHRIGGQYFLSEIWSAGTTEHVVAYPTKAEKQAMRELAANQLAAQSTEVTLAQATK